jgi:lincosamide and streptogramin A transport system ATP-binding/permease protein
VDRGYVGRKAAKMQKRAKAVAARRDKAFREKASMARNAEIRYELAMTPLASRKARLAEAAGLSCAARGGPAAFSGVSFSVEAGGRAALAGPNGSGKSLLLKLLAGGRALSGPGVRERGPVRGGAAGAAGVPGIPGAPAGAGRACGPDAAGGPWTETASGILIRGSFRAAAGIRVSYVPQEPEFGEGETLRDLALAEGVDEGRYKTVLTHLGFGRDRLSAAARDLSRGQRKKALLGLSIAASAHLYLWDEPLDHVDIMTRMQLEELIEDAKPTLVAAEHDLAFLERLGFKMIHLGGGKA